MIPKYRRVDGGYSLLETFTYRSNRYDKDITLYDGMFSDGATGAFDIHSAGWWVHDQICNQGKWDDGTEITNWQASRVLSDILWNEKRWLRAIYWLPATWLVGGGECRKRMI